MWYSNQLINKFLQAIWLFVPTYSRINIKVRTNWFCILFSILFRYYFSFLFYLSARYAVRKIISPSKFHSLSIWRRNGILMRISDIRLQFLFSFPFEIKERHLLELITTFLRYCRQSENRSLIFNNCIFSMIAVGGGEIFTLLSSSLYIIVISRDFIWKNYQKSLIITIKKITLQFVFSPFPNLVKKTILRLTRLNIEHCNSFHIEFKCKLYASLQVKFGSITFSYTL